MYGGARRVWGSPHYVRSWGSLGRSGTSWRLSVARSGASQAASWRLLGLSWPLLAALGPLLVALGALLAVAVSEQAVIALA